MPAMKSVRMRAPKDGAGSMSAAAMSMTSLTPSTITPSVCVPASPPTSTMTMQLRRPLRMRSRPKRAARSITGTTRATPVAPARSTREPRRIGLGNAQPAFASAAADPEYVRF
jgi:hypothetical protein